jgi:hypothetical protein
MISQARGPSKFNYEQTLAVGAGHLRIDTRATRSRTPEGGSVPSAISSQVTVKRKG